MKILVIRNQYPKSVEASFCLNTLLGRDDFEVTQFAPVAPAKPQYYDGDPAFCPNISQGLVTDRRQIMKRLRRHEFDLVFLLPYSNLLVGTLADLARWSFRIPIPRVARLVRRARPLFQCLPERCFEHTPTIVLDLDDPSELDHAEIRWLMAGRLYFKREIPFDLIRLFPARTKPAADQLAIAEANLRYIPLGLDDARYAQLRQHRRPPAERDIDIFWACNITNTQRRTALEKLRSLRTTTPWNIVIADAKLSFGEYCDLASRSKVMLSVSGFGWDCYRHAEAIALGAVPLMNRPTVDARAWVDLPQALFFENSFLDFAEKIGALLSSGALREELFGVCERRVGERCLWSEMMNHVLEETRVRFPQIARQGKPPLA